MSRFTSAIGEKILRRGVRRSFPSILSLSLRFKVADESIKDETGCTTYEYFVSDLY